MIEKALLVTIDLPKKSQFDWDIEDYQQELLDLAISSNVEVADEMIISLKRITPRFFVGKGKVEELARIVQDKKIQVVIVSEDLSFVQQRNIEEFIATKVIDRTQLILDIFAHRAHSREGKVQVELAQLRYLLPRLVGKGIMLSRLGGGIGTRGPGEQKLEVDRRRIRKKIEQLQCELIEITARRNRMREKRKKQDLLTAALVGYTNAGKSTLLNTLAHADTMVQDKLFCTLDPLARQLTLPNNQKIVIVDTVGFLHKLPHHLIESFKATLEEVVHADLILHVLDISHKCADLMAMSVFEILHDLGVDDCPLINVLNKSDCIENENITKRAEKTYDNSVVISAIKNEGIDQLFDECIKITNEYVSVVEFIIPLQKYQILNLVYEKGKVLERRDTNDGIYVKASIPRRILYRLRKERII